LALLELAVELEQEFELSEFQESAVEARLDTVGDVEDAIVRFLGEHAA
jgi:acyl carrier protein